MCAMLILTRREGETLTVSPSKDIDPGVNEENQGAKGRIIDGTKIIHMDKVCCRVSDNICNEPNARSAGLCLRLTAGLR